MQDTVKGKSFYYDKTAGLRRHSEEVNKIVVESLQGALLLLMAQKPFKSITVSELCRKAGVSRMAFYGNFGSKDDIFKQIFVNLHREMMARVGSPFVQQPSVKWYKDMFDFVKEKSGILQPIFNAGYREKYLQLVNSMILDHTELSCEETYALLLWCGGVINAVAHWLVDGMQTSPAEMANCCYHCFANFTI